jgi:hypothetical protein
MATTTIRGGSGSSSVTHLGEEAAVQPQGVATLGQAQVQTLLLNPSSERSLQTDGPGEQIRLARVGFALPPDPKGGV